MRLPVAFLITVLIVACRSSPPPAPPPTEEKQRPAPHPGVLEARRVQQVVDKINARGGKCSIATGGGCCLSYEAVRSDHHRPAGRSPWADPDYTEGRPGAAARGPLLCARQRAPTDVRLAADGGCELVLGRQALRNSGEMRAGL